MHNPLSHGQWRVSFFQNIAARRRQTDVCIDNIDDIDDNIDKGTQATKQPQGTGSGYASGDEAGREYTGRIVLVCLVAQVGCAVEPSPSMQVHWLGGRQRRVGVTPDAVLGEHEQGARVARV